MIGLMTRLDTSHDGESVETTGQVNLKYGNDPGVAFYTHISDQYAPFHTKVINAAVRDTTHVLNGLLFHESDCGSRSITLMRPDSPTTSLLYAICSISVSLRASLTATAKSCSEPRYRSVV